MEVLRETLELFAAAAAAAAGAAVAVVVVVDKAVEVADLLATEDLTATGAAAALVSGTASKRDDNVDSSGAFSRELSTRSHLRRNSS
jgi:hypothetical protein